MDSFERGKNFAMHATRLEAGGRDLRMEGGGWIVVSIKTEYFALAIKIVTRSALMRGGNNIKLLATEGPS